MFKPLDKDQYAAEFIRELKKFGISDEPKYDSKSFSLSYSNSHVTNLGNFYQEYCSVSILHRQSVLKSAAKAMAITFKDAEIDLTPEEVRRCLRPRIHSRIYFEAPNLKHGLRKESSSIIPFKAVGQHLALSIVIDTPTSMVTPKSEGLESWGFTFDEALDIANTNLKNAADAQFKPVRDGLYMSTNHDFYDASRLHIPEFISRLPIKGRPVAMVPNRNELIVTGADDEQGLVGMAKLAHEILKQPRPLSSRAFRLDAKWVPFLPNRDHPAYSLIRNMAVDEIVESYKRQTDIFIEHFAEDGTDIFVASALVRQMNDSELKETYCVWSAGIPTMLPKTDVVAFMLAPGTRPLILNWSKAIGSFGDLMKPMTTYPKRYFVKDIPPIDEIKALAIAH